MGALILGGGAVLFVVLGVDRHDPAAFGLAVLLAIPSVLFANNYYRRREPPMTTNTDAELIAAGKNTAIRLFNDRIVEAHPRTITRGATTEEAEIARLLCRFADRLAALTAEGATGVPEGWKLVPVKATAKMIAYGEGYADFVLPSGFENTQESRRREMAMAYGVMVEASPNPPDRPEQSASEPGRSGGALALLLTKPWRVMTPEEYASMEIRGPYVVERNYGGCGNIGVWLTASAPTGGPAPVEAPHSVDQDASVVHQFIMQSLRRHVPIGVGGGGVALPADTPRYFITADQALAALGRLADGARR